MYYASAANSSIELTKLVIENL